MSRESENYRKFLAEEAALERAEQERREAPAKAAEAALLATQRQLNALERERVLSGRDPDLFITPSLQGAGMSHEQASKFSADGLREFRRNSSSWWYASQANIDLLLGYFERNTTFICDAEMFERAAKRLAFFHAFEAKPEPEPAPEPVRVREPEASKQSETMTGVDWKTGLPLTLTMRQVDALSADEFRKFTKVIPTVAEWLTTSNRLQGRSR